MDGKGTKLVIRLLLVDDEPLLREAVAEELREIGWHVTEAETGDDAIRLLVRRADFDIVLTDVRMPGAADGIEVAMRALQSVPRIPVLVMSGFAPELGHRLGILMPPSAFIPKPFTFAQISQALRELLAARGCQDGVH